MALHGKTALITGGTSGIGRAVAERLASDGAEVIISGRDEGRGREVVQAIEAAGGTARFIAADLASFADVRRLAAAARDVDVLVNNAGVFPGGPTDQTTEEAFDLTFDVNVKAPFFLTAAIAPRMAEKGGGSIINISTMAATIGMNGLAAYGASKAAVESLTKAWTAEYAAQGVRVNTVAPGQPAPRPAPRWAKCSMSLHQAPRPGTAQPRTRSPALSASSLPTTRASSTARSCPPTAAESPSDSPNALTQRVRVARDGCTEPSRERLGPAARARPEGPARGLWRATEFAQKPFDHRGAFGQLSVAYLAALQGLHAGVGLRTPFPPSGQLTSAVTA